MSQPIEITPEQKTQIIYVIVCERQNYDSHRGLHWYESSCSTSVEWSKLRRLEERKKEAREGTVRNIRVQTIQQTLLSEETINAD